jgi:hypothetical protein
MSKFKAEEFLKDIGLDVHVTILKRTTDIKDNIYVLPVTIVDAEVAVMRNLDNLSATYGASTLMDILLKYTKE